MKHKKLFISLTAVLTVIVFFAIFLMIWFFGDRYGDFEDFRQEFEIPGLGDGAVPQGADTCRADYSVVNDDGAIETKKQNYFFISAYMTDKSPSRIYVVAKDTNEVGYVTLKAEDGSDFYGHCGGIAINNAPGTVTTSNVNDFTLWVTGESNVYVAKPSKAYAEAKKTIAQEIVEKAMGVKLDPADEDGEVDNSITFTTSFKANCNASFCFYFDDPSTDSITSDRLYVGEFYRAGNYETDKSHWLTTPTGYLNKAFMYEYNVTTNSYSKYGLTNLSADGIEGENQVPRIQKIFSLPEQVQGVAFSGKTSGSNYTGKLVLSTSYGLDNSHLLTFDYSTMYSARTTYSAVTGVSFEYDGVQKVIGGQATNYTDGTIAVYYADRTNENMFLYDFSIPSMSEGMFLVTPPGSHSNSPVERVYVLFESACKKYGMFVRESLNHVYSFTPRV